MKRWQERTLLVIGLGVTALALIGIANYVKQKPPVQPTPSNVTTVQAPSNVTTVQAPSSVIEKKVVNVV